MLTIKLYGTLSFLELKAPLQNNNLFAVLNIIFINTTFMYNFSHVSDVFSLVVTKNHYKEQKKRLKNIGLCVSTLYNVF